MEFPLPVETEAGRGAGTHAMRPIGLDARASCTNPAPIRGKNSRFGAFPGWHGTWTTWVATPQPPTGSGRRPKEDTMLHYALIFLVVAIIAAVLGFTGIAGAAAGIAKILAIVFLVLFVGSMIFGRKRA
jgi:uncharacterized membrane protein YtjA (UPF0391 family)